MIVIVGGGITGLVLALELQRRGIEYVVLESERRPGGVIKSAEVNGHVVDWGPQRARLTKGMRELVHDVGLTDQLLLAPPDLPLFIYKAGALRVVPTSLPSLLRSDVVGLREKMRIVAEPFTRGPDPSERVADFFTRKLGRGLYESVVGPLYGGLYASDPADMLVGHSLIHVLKAFDIGRSLTLAWVRNRRQPLPLACSFRGGMQVLTDAIATQLGDNLRLGTPARRVHQAGQSWRVDLDSQTVEADAVVLTTPARTTADLVRDGAPEIAAAIERLTYNTVVVVHLCAETSLRGMGFQVAFSEGGLALRGVTFNDSLFGRKDLYTAYLGGAFHPDVATMNDRDLEQLAIDEFRLCTGSDARAMTVGRATIPAWDVSWRALDGMAFPPRLHVAANWWSRVGLTGRLAEARGLSAELGKGRVGG